MNSQQFSIDFDSRLPVAAQIGMKQADDNAAEDWKRWFDGCVMAAAKKHSSITSDDVLTEIEALPRHPSTHNLAAIGPAMMRASKMGLIRATDRTVRSRRSEKNGNLHRIWESLVFNP